MSFGKLVGTTGVRLVAIGVAALSLSACSMGSMFAPSSPSTTSTLQTATPTQAELQTGASNALPAIATECPPIRVKPGGEALF